jgi:putative nucleotidyltransferase with HDIG domain
MDNLESGMTVARSVIGLDGRALLNQNTMLTEQYISGLKKLGIGSVYIKDGLANVETPEVVTRQVLSSVASTLNDSLKTFSAGKTMNMESLKNGIITLLEDIIRNPNMLIQLEDIRTFDDYVFFHSVNVAVFALMTGRSLGYQEGNLVELGLGALLHDIGMITIDPAILNKPDELSTSEQEQMRKHPEVGFNILRTYREVSTKAAHIAFQHHEKVDGTGYPRQLREKQILEFAKIVAVTDTFDAITSDRPHRNGYSTTDGIIILQKLVNSYFSPEIVEAFVSNVALYPVGSLLSLNTGHIAVVTSVNRINATRPVINVICDQDGILVRPTIKINLNKTKEVTIVKRLNYHETELIKAKIAMGTRLHSSNAIYSEAANA